MGTFGPGNFQNDGALDYVAELAVQLVERINDSLQGRKANPDELGETVLVPSVDILRLLCAHCSAPVPEKTTIQAWKDKYLHIWNSRIDATHPAPGYKEERRAVIVQTFDNLLQLAK